MKKKKKDIKIKGREKRERKNIKEKKNERDCG
jgi:hypothetical protein